jgi:hypothetical protein
MVIEAIYGNDALPLEEINFRNLVFFYINELKAIHGGTESLEILSVSERAKLKDAGIIDYSFGKTWITKKTLQILKKLEEQ